MISERTKSALKAAKARGVKLGTTGTAATAARARAAKSAYAAKSNANIAAVVREIRSSGVETLTGIAAALSARGVKTPRGSAVWYPAQVARLVAA